MEFEEIGCILCQEISNKTAIFENGYHGKKCPKCGLIYISPRPTLSSINEMYRKDKAELYEKALIACRGQKELISRYTLNLIKSLKLTGSLLEIGAGAGFFLNEAKKKGFNVRGIELNESLALFIQNQFGIACDTNGPTFQGDDVKYDVIYHCNVLSHFFNPLEEFKTINKRLKNGGALIFETGNYSDLDKKYYSYIKSFEYPDHLFLFGEESIKKLLALSGFRIVKIYRHSLLFYFKIKKILNCILRKKEIKTAGSATIKTSSITTVLSQRSLKQRASEYFYFYCVYRIGALLARRNEPQNIIVIAKKE
jgi:2-polyprenyl-3-methyl-5-hydroxy-6-metoxy-1,4-benzoquinol methylase